MLIGDLRRHHGVLVVVEVPRAKRVTGNSLFFASRKGGYLTELAVNGMVKRTARKAGINST